MTTNTIIDAVITTWRFIDYTSFLLLLLLYKVESFVTRLSEFEKENQLEITCDCYLSVTIIIFAEKQVKYVFESSKSDLKWLRSEKFSALTPYEQVATQI